MHKTDTARISTLGAAAVTLIVVALAGCSAASTASESTAVENSPATSESTSVSSPLPGEAAISADHVCGQVSTLAAMEANTVGGFTAGVVSSDEYVAQIATVATGYEHVLVDDSDVGDRVTDVVAFLKTAEASAEGARFDPSSTRWISAVSAVGQECSLAGSSIAVLADFGG